MSTKNSHNRLKHEVKKSISQLEQSKKESSSILAQTIYLGTLGVIFILPIILGAYIGVWLDNKLHGFSIAWTLNLIIVGIIIGAINVYLFIKD